MGKSKGLVFKKRNDNDNGMAIWACTAAPIEISGGPGLAYSVYVRGIYVGGYGKLAQAKERGVAAWKGEPLEDDHE